MAFKRRPSLARYTRADTPRSRISMRSTCMPSGNRDPMTPTMGPW
jgi:hypothetical protein